MSDTSLLQQFHLFPSLPPELRLQIWKEALTNSGVWLAHCPAAGNARSKVHIPSADKTISLSLVPSASPARLACSEAWHLMQSLRCKRFLVAGSPTANRLEGMHLEKSVLHLGTSLNAERTLQAMMEQELSLVKHAAIEWARCSYDAHAVGLLTRNAKGLRTIIFQDVDWEAERLDPASAAALAAFFMTLPDSTMREKSTGSIQDPLWRDLWINICFPNARVIPKIHFVNPKQLLKLG